MPDRLICTTSDNTPDWVIERARQLGIEFVPLRESGLDEMEPESNLALTSRLHRDDVAEQLIRRQPVGYLMNGPPDYGPYFDAELAAAAPNLRLVTYFGQSLEPAEYDPFLDVAALSHRGIALTTAPGATESVAEGTIALLLALDLDLVPHNAARKENRDSQVSTRTGLYGRRLGIVGMGQIGQRVAEIAHALGMKIFYTSRTRKPTVERDLAARYVDLPALFAESHFVSIHTPSSVTEGLIDRTVLSNARGISLVNSTSVARIVDPEALIDALDDGRVARTAIEGRYAEPHDSRLRAFGDDRVLLLPPYMSWETERSWRTGWENYLETLDAFVAGRPLPYQIVYRDEPPFS